MLIVLSPAKTLDFDSELRTRKHSLPTLVNDSAELVAALVQKSPTDLAELMHLSPALADLNAERYQDWEREFTIENSRPALLAFKGDVYVGMDVSRYSERDFTRAQKTLRILSGLHGVLRPLDLIQPYRLEMGTRLATQRGTDLYDFWGDQITTYAQHRSRRSPLTGVNQLGFQRVFLGNRRKRSFGPRCQSTISSMRKTGILKSSASTPNRHGERWPRG